MKVPKHCRACGRRLEPYHGPQHYDIYSGVLSKGTPLLICPLRPTFNSYTTHDEFSFHKGFLGIGRGWQLSGWEI